MEPRERIVAYFEACGNGSVTDIASHFTVDAVVFDTNIKPVRGAEQIGLMWVKVRERWGGAQWSMDSCIAEGGSSHQRSAAIEWSMTGSSAPENEFVFRGSEHYRFVDSLIAEIRQYWTFDPDVLDTGLRGYEYEVPQT